MRARASLGVALAVGMTALEGTAFADDVLIFQQKTNDPQGGDEAAAEAALVFEDLGHTVTLESSFNPTLPSDLSAFDTVWIVSLTPLTGPQITTLTTFVEGGGGLYLTGENNCCEQLNSGITNLLTPMIRSPYPLVGQTAESGGDLFTPTPDDPFGITSDPNVITQWDTQAAGIIANVAANRAVFEKADGDAGAAALPPEHLVRGTGCVYIAMDLTFWQASVAPSQDLAPYVENIQAFLNGCRDSDGDGLSDQGEGEYGTGVDDPDSDGDGLCDGYGEVAGVCIAGEHPQDNYDNDGDIPPLDEDDDNDGIPTAFEVAAEALAPNVDGDNIPAWDDLDSDGDILLDEQEGPGDYDNDGIPAIVDLDDFPMTCRSDANCGAADSGVVCNVDVGGYCHPGCRGMAGNGCPDGQTCTSTDDTIGECLGGGEGGGGQGGGGQGGGGQGGSPNGSGGGPGAGGSGTGGATDGGDGPADDDCDCSAIGARGSSWGGLVTLGALALLVRRRRR